MSGLDIKNINLQGESNFLNADIETTNTNRETFRSLKHSFDSISNIIEANKYYQKEMQKREEELKENEYIEWIVFKLHGIASNHSQDWLLSLFWIIVIGFLSATYDCCIIEQKCTYSMFSEPILYISSCLVITILIMKYCFNEISKIVILVFTFSLYLFLTLDLKFEYLAKTINPFSVMLSGDNLDIIQFIFKVIIAYLIYQFIISIRQNTRRK